MSAKDSVLSAPTHIAAIAPYQAGKPIEELAREFGLDASKIVKLASNENPLGMPESAKQVLTQRLRSAPVSVKHQDEFTRMADFMNNGASLDGFILRMRVADLDRKRQQNLADVEPEFAQLINYAGPN